MRGFCQSQGSLQFNLGFFQLRSLHGDFQNGLLQHVSIMLIGKEIESQQISNPLSGSVSMTRPKAFHRIYGIRG